MGLTLEQYQALYIQPNYTDQEVKSTNSEPKKFLNERIQSFYESREGEKSLKNIRNYVKAKKKVDDVMKNHNFV